MSPDLGRLLKDSAARPTGHPDIEHIWRTARRRRTTGRVVGGAAILVLAVASYAGAARLLNNESSDDRVMGTDERPSDVTMQERAAIFAIRAMGQAGLREQDGTYVDYRETEELDANRWNVLFGPPTDCSSGTHSAGDNGTVGVIDDTRTDGWRCRDLSTETVSLIVLRDADAFSIVKVAGPLTDEQNAALLAAKAPDRSEPPAMELSDVDVATDSWGTIVHASVLWTGSGSETHMQRCTLRLISPDGSVRLRDDIDPLFESDSYAGESDRAWYEAKLGSGGVPGDSLRDGHFHEIVAGDTIPEADVEIECLPIDVGEEKRKQDAEDKRVSDETQADCEAHATACIATDASALQLLATDDAVWVPNDRSDDGWALSRMDVERNEVVATIPTGGFVRDMTADGDLVWVLVEVGEQDATLEAVAVDPATDSVVRRVPLGAAGNIGTPAIAADAGVVWATGPNGRVQRIDPGAQEPTTFELAGSFDDYNADQGPLRMAASDSKVWVANGAGQILQLEAESGRVLGEVLDLGWNLVDIATGEGYLWASHTEPAGNHHLWQIRAESLGEDVDFIIADASLERYGHLYGPVVGDGSIWALRGEPGSPGTVFRFDPPSGIVGERIEAPDGFEALAVTDQAIWLIKPSDGTVMRIDT